MFRLSKCSRLCKNCQNKLASQHTTHPIHTTSTSLVTIDPHPGHIRTSIAIPAIFPLITVAMLVHPVTTAGTLVASTGAPLLYKLPCMLVRACTVSFPSHTPLRIGRVVLTRALPASTAGCCTKHLHPRRPPWNRAVGPPASTFWGVSSVICTSGGGEDFGEGGHKNKKKGKNCINFRWINMWIIHF